jgi:hypothetical protein
MGSGASINIPSFIKSGSASQKIIRGIHIHRQQSDRISFLIFFQNKESRLRRQM